MPKVETRLAAAPRLLRPIGAQAHTVDRFEWEGGAGAARHTLVLLSAGYEELARRALGDGNGWSSDTEVAALLACGGTFHWFVLADRAGGAVKSPIESFATP